LAAKTASAAKDRPAGKCTAIRRALIKLEAVASKVEGGGGTPVNLQFKYQPSNLPAFNRNIWYRAPNGIEKNDIQFCAKQNGGPKTAVRESPACAALRRNAPLPDGPAIAFAPGLGRVVEFHLRVFGIGAGRGGHVVMRARAPDVELMGARRIEIGLMAGREVGGNGHTCDGEKNATGHCSNNPSDTHALTAPQMDHPNGPSG
jgi:hypothetical protein